MTQDEIIEMAIQAGFEEHQAKFDTRFEPFAKLVAAKEREDCAKVCDELVNEENSGDYQNAANWCSERIRARGEASHSPQRTEQEPLIPFRHGCKWCGKTGACEHSEIEAKLKEKNT